jgi:hypothetical protein
MTVDKTVVTQQQTAITSVPMLMFFQEPPPHVDLL